MKYSNSEILRKVANRELTPDEAVQLMMENDKEASRPIWIPKKIWDYLYLLF